jgi:HAD superfamily hydrolase (TIGR01509 family)
MSFELKAVLWDMDGTVINSEHYWVNAEYTLLNKFNLPWSHTEGENLKGTGMEHSIKLFKEKGVPLSTNEIIDFLNNMMVEQTNKKLHISDGFYELINDFKNRNIKNVLVTASYKVFVDAVLNKLQKNIFDAVITGDMVKHDKPAPDPYLLAAEKVNVNIKNCLGIEDSINGAKSVLSAGARLLALKGQIEYSDNIMFIDNFIGLSYKKIMDFLYTKT